MGDKFKKLRKAIGLGGRNHDVDNNEFVLDSIWPDGTWYLDEEKNGAMDVAVQEWLLQIYLYDKKLEFQKKHTQGYYGPANAFKVPFDWNPKADVIRQYHSDPRIGCSWEDEEINYILARLQSMNHLGT